MKKYLVKNISNKTVERANTLFLPHEEKEVYLNDYFLFQIKACVYLKVEEVIEDKEEIFTCEKCGKEYQSEHYYNKHVAKCGGDN